MDRLELFEFGLSLEVLMVLVLSKDVVDLIMVKVIEDTKVESQQD